MRMATGAAKPRGAGVGRVGPRAFAGGAGRRCASGSSCEQSGQERILLAHGVVGHDGDFAVAGCGHESDDSATLEEAEDALARATHEGLDLVLRGRWRWVEHPALAVAVGRVHAIQENRVQMRIEPQITVCALDDGHGAGLAGRQAAVDVSPSVPGRHGVREDAHHLTEQFAVERKREAQRKGHGQHELSQRHVGQNVIREVESPLVHPPAETTWARGSGLARERDNIVLVAGLAEEVGETSSQDPTT
jgi:hypothetical protein